MKVYMLQVREDLSGGEGFIGVFDSREKAVFEGERCLAFMLIEYSEVDPPESFTWIPGEGEEEATIDTTSFEDYEDVYVTVWAWEVNETSFYYS